MLGEKMRNLKKNREMGEENEGKGGGKEKRKRKR
jgi:hypothetical protein